MQQVKMMTQPPPDDVIEAAKRIELGVTSTVFTDAFILAEWVLSQAPKPVDQ